MLVRLPNGLLHYTQLWTVKTECLKFILPFGNTPRYFPQTISKTVHIEWEYWIIISDVFYWISFCTRCWAKFFNISLFSSNNSKMTTRIWKTNSPKSALQKCSWGCVVLHEQESTWSANIAISNTITTDNMSLCSISETKESNKLDRKEKTFQKVKNIFEKQPPNCYR